MYGFVLEVAGNPDEPGGIRLDLESHGERVRFEMATAESFTRADHLRVAQVGPWEFVVHGYAAETGPRPWHSLADDACLDFAPEGDVGRRIEPPIRSIPEFLRRLPEVREVVLRLPRKAPGEEIGSRTRLRLWAYRQPVE